MYSTAPESLVDAVQYPFSFKYYGIDTCAPVCYIRRPGKEGKSVDINIIHLNNIKIKRFILII